MNRLTRIASAMLIALVFVVLAACTPRILGSRTSRTVPAELGRWPSWPGLLVANASSS